MYEFEKELMALKDKMMMADNFRDVYNYFFDHLGENPEFMKQGSPSENPVLERVLEMVGRKLFKEEGKITKLMLTKIAKPIFYHGTCFLNGRMAGIMFFEEIDMGMIFVIISFASHETRLIRFSSVQMEHGGDMLVCKPETKTIH